MVDIVAEGTPQELPTIVEPMEEDSSNKEEVVTTLTIEPMEDDEPR